MKDSQWRVQLKVSSGQQTGSTCTSTLSLIMSLLTCLNLSPFKCNKWISHSWSEDEPISIFCKIGASVQNPEPAERWRSRWWKWGGEGETSPKVTKRFGKDSERCVLKYQAMWSHMKEWIADRGKIKWLHRIRSGFFSLQTSIQPMFCLVAFAHTKLPSEDGAHREWHLPRSPAHLWAQCKPFK